MCEETGLRRNHDYVLHHYVDPLTITFRGINNQLYTHSFYVGTLINTRRLNIALNKRNIHQCIEIGDIEWSDVKTTLEKIRPYNHYKKKLISMFLQVSVHYNL